MALAPPMGHHIPSRALADLVFSKPACENPGIWCAPPRLLAQAHKKWATHMGRPHLSVRCFLERKRVAHCWWQHRCNLWQGHCDQGDQRENGATSYGTDAVVVQLAVNGAEGGLDLGAGWGEVLASCASAKCWGGGVQGGELCVDLLELLVGVFLLDLLVLELCLDLSALLDQFGRSLDVLLQPCVSLSLCLLYTSPSPRDS